jgi:hypothetical protein
MDLSVECARIRAGIWLTETGYRHQEPAGNNLAARMFRFGLQVASEGYAKGSNHFAQFSVCTWPKAATKFGRIFNKR